MKSRHGTVHYFRRRVPAAARQLIGRQVHVQSLETSDRRLAIRMSSTSNNPAQLSHSDIPCR
ncbi:DUF6538 domain-containing protein [Massilia sp. BJB1822]|uniref:DUF6538 domain-containing protein n=1 Tax=Massilia sp. BJB1822 TaxID=2744470 RepID=UPI0035A714CF